MKDRDEMRIKEGGKGRGSKGKEEEREEEAVRRKEEGGEGRPSEHPQDPAELAEIGFRSTFPAQRRGFLHLFSCSRGLAGRGWREGLGGRMG